jgi:AraC-like DNA-binding protein
MLYFISGNKHALIHVSSGKLQCKDNFIHAKRKLDTFVIIICVEGRLHIVQNSIKYTLKENQYLLLFSGHEHFGYKKTEGKLSYYWCHFRVEQNDYRILSQDNIFLKNLFLAPETGERNESNKPIDKDTLLCGAEHYSLFYIIPEYGDVSLNGRAILIFKQLLDIARNNCYTNKFPNYALSLLAMEISQEYIENNFLRDSSKDINPKMEKIIEWIRINYNLNLTVKKIARIFMYNPDYLSTVFKKYKGIPLLKYVNMVKIAKAKELLLNSTACIKEIAYQAGFGDEKNFMKRFKQSEDITPTKYRNAFCRTKIVKK